MFRTLARAGPLGPRITSDRPRSVSASMLALLLLARTGFRGVCYKMRVESEGRDWFWLWQLVQHCARRRGIVSQRAGWSRFHQFFVCLAGGAGGGGGRVAGGQIGRVERASDRKKGTQHLRNRDSLSRTTSGVRRARSQLAFDFESLAPSLPPASPAFARQVTACRTQSLPWRCLRTRGLPRPTRRFALIGATRSANPAQQVD